MTKPFALFYHEERKVGFLLHYLGEVEGQHHLYTLDEDGGTYEMLVDPDHPDIAFLSYHPDALPQLIDMALFTKNKEDFLLLTHELKLWKAQQELSPKIIGYNL